LVAAVASASLVGPNPLASAADRSNVSVTIDASPYGSEVEVTGLASFEASEQVGTDERGNVFYGGGVPFAGFDLASGHISAQRSPERLVFSVQVSDPLLSDSTLPEIVDYQWHVEVDGGPGLVLEALRSAQYPAPGSLAPVFRLLNANLEHVSTLTGRIESGVIEWDVPMATIGAREGSEIAPGNRPYSTTYSCWSASGTAMWLFCPDGMVVDDYTVPTATIDLGIAPAGTPSVDVDVTTRAMLDSNGAFTGRLDASGLAPGTYVVVARACYGSASCAFDTANVTLAGS
jgi:hypothetical protein